jgi:DNA-binding phage protein
MNIKQTISSEFWKQYGNVDKFARESKLNPKTVFKFLYNDEYNPKIDTLRKMLDVLGLELIVRKVEHE